MTPNTDHGRGGAAASRSRLDRAQRVLERLSQGIEAVAGVLLGLVALIVLASAVGRYLFAYPLPDAFDLSRFMLGAAIMWGFASLGYRGAHIKVDLVAELLPPRARRRIDAFAWTVLLIFTALLTWKLLGRVVSAAGSGEATMDLRLPAWPFLLLIWAGVAVSLVTIVARLVVILNGRGSLDAFEAIDSEVPGDASDPKPGSRA